MDQRERPLRNKLKQSPIILKALFQGDNNPEIIVRTWVQLNWWSLASGPHFNLLVFGRD